MKNRLLQLSFLSINFLLSGMAFQMVLQQKLFAIELAQKVVSVHNAVIKIDAIDISITDAFSMIESQTEYTFGFAKKDIDQAVRLNLNVNNETVASALTEFSKISNLRFKQENNNIHVSKISDKRQPAIIIENSQTNTVTGKVTSQEDDEGLPGVNVIEKGTSNGTVTDIEGRYSLDVSEGAILVFSSVGYTREEVAVDGRSVVDLAMAADIQQLDELVVIGYGSVRKSDLTGSVFSMKEDELKSGINENIDGKIKGKIPGVSVMQTSGNPGAAPRIRIRGSSSITGSNRPLYVIDGVPFDDSSLGAGLPNNYSGSETSGLNSVNLADVESLEVLKGPSAVAIYGARGSNGVILITTKQGVKGQAKVSYNFEGGFKETTKKLDLLTTSEFISVRNEIAGEYNEDPVFSASDIENIRGADWQDEIFRRGSYQNHTVSFSGGNNSATYYASLNYYDEDGIVISSGIKKYNGRLNLSLKASDRLTLGLNININRIDDDLVHEGASNEHAGVIGGSHIFDPTIAAERQPNGKYLTALHLENPLNAAEGYIAARLTSRSYGVASAQYQIFPALSVNFKLGLDQQSAERSVYRSRQTIFGNNTNGTAYLNNASRYNVLYEGTMTYMKDFKKHSFNLMGGTTFEKFTTNSNNIEISNFPTDETQHFNLGLGDTELDAVNSGYAAHSLLSFFARVNYTYNNKYLVTSTFRADGSSRFGENNRFGYFPSLALAWRMSEEPFISQLDLFSHLKVRTSWGITGNQEIGNYQSYSTFSRSNNPISLSNTLISVLEPARMPNPNLKWEQRNEYNIGVDFGVFNGRLSGSFDYFHQITNDLLFDKPVPPNSGFATMLENIGKVQNSGIEVLLETKNTTGKFAWSTGFNFSVVKNEVLDLGPVNQIVHGAVATTSQIGLIRVGEAMNSYYGHQVEGIWQEDEDASGSAQPNAKPGFIKFKDQNNDGKINEEDLVPLGSSEPDFTYGLTNTFSYKNFDLTVFIQGMQGITLLNGTLLRSFYPVDYTNNRIAGPWLNRWTPSNPTNKFPSGVDYNAYGGSQVNDLTLQDASFLRIQNIHLSYRIPAESMKFISGINLNFMINNAFTFTNYNGYNPEAAQATEMPVRADFNSYPLARTYALGINFDF